MEPKINLEALQIVPQFDGFRFTLCVSSNAVILSDVCVSVGHRWDKAGILDVSEHL